MTDKNERPWLVWLILAAIMGIVLASDFLHYTYVQAQPPPRPWRSIMTLDHFRRIAAALTGYTTHHGRRPESLDTLAVGDKTAVRDLLHADGRRIQLRRHVLYFPALRPDDPPDTVLLCTLVRGRKDDKLLVAYNDGRIARLTAHAMIIALNRTYRFIGEDIAFGQSTTAPATQQVN